MYIIIAENAYKIRCIDQISLKQIISDDLIETFGSDLLSRVSEFTDRVVLYKCPECRTVADRRQLRVSVLLRTHSLIIHAYKARRNFFQCLIIVLGLFVGIYADDLCVAVAGFPEIGEEECPVAACTFGCGEQKIRTAGIRENLSCRRDRICTCSAVGAGRRF